MPTRSSNIPAPAGLCAEGGYDLDALAESTASHIQELMRRRGDLRFAVQA
ncbi:MAG TPA: hypothetical protein VK630_07310 [Reyranella sp.]|nr:hypothetical protein [Reyranella sp.]